MIIVEIFSLFHKQLLKSDIYGIVSINYIFFIFIILLDNNQLDNNQIIDKMIYLYNYFNIKIYFNIKELTIKLFDVIKLIDIKKINKINLLNEIFEYYLNTENLTNTKYYVKFYDKKILSEWIFNLGNPTISEQMNTIFFGNTKINSYLNILVEKCQDKKINFIKIYDKLYGYQNNKIIKSLELVNIMLKSNKKFSENFNKNFSSDDLLTKDINLSTNSFDLIYFDFPSGIHNIIYANCCNKIKKLKLRGTKYEPLLLQLIMYSLNINGCAILIVPDNLLFSDSVQHVETRKHLIKNFNVKKIIQIDESLYVDKGNRNSILYFENNGSTKSVEFTKISLKTNEHIIEETNQSDIPIDKIKSNIYSLYYKNYESIKNLNQDIKSKNFNELFEFNTNLDLFTNKQFICLEKYYKNDKSISIGSIKQDCWEHYIIAKNNESNNFNIKLLKNILKAKYQYLIKGKMNQFDLNKISQLKIPIMSEQIINHVCEYMHITDKIIIDNNEKINSTYKLKWCLMNSISLDKMILINKITKLYDKKTIIEPSIKMIGIIRNSLSAGQVYILDSTDNISTNSHYLIIKDTNYLLDFVYQWFKYNESKLKEIANLNFQPNLSQINLLKFKIPEISIESQIEIINSCNDFDSIINNYHTNNKSLLDKDILGTILKINMCINN